MNARRSQVYNALFKCENGYLARLCEDRALAIAELDEELSNKTEPIYLSGDGYEITEKGFNRTKLSYVPERQRYQSAYSVAQIALRKYETGEYINDAALVPIYLRPSQAERERQERLSKESN